MRIADAAAIVRAGEQMQAYLGTREGKMLVRDLAERSALMETTVRTRLYAAALDVPFNPERARASILEMWEA